MLSVPALEQAHGSLAACYLQPSFLHRRADRTSLLQHTLLQRYLLLTRGPLKGCCKTLVLKKHNQRHHHPSPEALVLYKAAEILASLECLF